MKVISDFMIMPTKPRLVSSVELRSPVKQEPKSKPIAGNEHNPTYEWIEHQVGQAIW